MTQEQFDGVIDLLGDVSMARLAFETLSSDVDKAPFQAEIDSALGHYNDAVAMLYPNEVVPALYGSAYLPQSRNGSSSCGSGKVSIQTTYIIDISAVTKQLNQDFVLSDNTEEEIFTPLQYAGRYRTTVPTQIQLEAAFKQSPDAGFFPIVIPSFLMDLLSNFLTLVVGGILVGAGAQVIASGIGAVLGTCMIVVGAALVVGHTAASVPSLGFFSASRETQPSFGGANPLNLV